MVIIITWLIAGSLDYAAALLLFITRSRQKPSLLLRFITSAVFGAKAFSGGSGMIFLGLCLHYLIALCWTIFYFAVFPRLFPCSTVLTNAIVFGLFIWAGMNLVVLPLTKAERRAFSPLIAFINIFILVIAIGLPCAYVTEHYSFQFGF